MKSRILVIFVFLGIICSAFVACKSSNSKNVSEDKKSKVMKIGLSLPTEQEDRWVRDKQSIQEECKKQGIEFLTATADMNADKQEAQCVSMISKGISVLIIGPYDSEKSVSIVSAAHAKGVKVISYDRLISDVDIDLYLSFDNEKVGELQAQELLKTVPKGNYVVLSGAENDNNSKYLLKGAMNKLEPCIKKGDIKLVGQASVADWSPENAYKIAANFLAKNNNSIDAILAPNDGTASGCIRALEEKNLVGKVGVTGQDAELTAAIRVVKGEQLMTVFKDTRELGKKSVELAVKMIKEEKIEYTSEVENNKFKTKTVLLPPLVVDKLNIDKVLINSGYLKRESVYQK